MGSKEGLCLMLDTWAIGSLSELAAVGWLFRNCRDLGEAKVALEQGDYQVGLVVLALGLQGELHHLEELVRGHPLTKWIALVKPEFLDSENAPELICRYFYDYHTAPIDVPRLAVSLGRAMGIAGLKRRCLSPLPVLDNGSMIGNSLPMKKLAAAIYKVARAEAPVMINGESGTGKELAARAVHYHSDRASGPFIAVNCGALPPSLIQSELFGYEKGAFSGAHASKTGLIEAAMGGTIFFDEIGDVPLELQTNLLRFLQEKTISRVGSTKSIAVDVRVIAATHVDLEKAVMQFQFREDLYYRLHVLHLQMPALRDRRGDVELLAHHFLEKFSQEQHVKRCGFTRRAMQVMQSYSWPGNVRELINRVRRAVVMCEDGLISPRDIGLERRSEERYDLSSARASAERAAIQASLLSCGHNISQTARNLGISRVTLYRLLEKYALIAKPSP